MVPKTVGQEGKWDAGVRDQVKAGLGWLSKFWAFFLLFFFNKSTQIQKQDEISWVRGEKQPPAWAVNFWCNECFLGERSRAGSAGHSAPAHHRPGTDLSSPGHK